MKLKINNVGVIQNSEINISGLTIITGNNNSGKSTVGKVLSSIVSSTINLKENAFIEKVSYAKNIVIRVSELLFDNVLFRNKKNKEYLLLNFPIFTKIMDYTFLFNSDFSSINELRDFLIELKKEIERIEYDVLIQSIADKYKKSNSYEAFNNNRHSCIEKLNNLIQTLYQDADLLKYSSKKILDDLNNNFNEQISPVKNPKVPIEISLKTNEEIYYEIKILNGKINDKSFFKNPFNHCFLINDVNILDKLSQYKGSGRKKYMHRYLLLDDIRYTSEDLNDRLLNALTENLTSFESQTYSQKYSKYIELLSDSFSEEIVLVDGKYVCKSSLLDVRNLATGSKLFAIIKLLLERGKIDSQTLIVLDEPENHLHPKWQLVLAKLIVMMVKDLDVKFVITTHSPSFLLALETYSKKFYMDDYRTNYYYSELCDNHYNVKIIDVNFNKDKIHYAINKPFIDINNLFEEYSED